MMITATDIARVCYEANREYCACLGDLSQRPWSDASLWQQESVIKGVLAIREGLVTRPEQSHESWSQKLIESGWTWGFQKDESLKTHPCLVPFSQLPVEQQAKDLLFFAIASALL